MDHASSAEGAVDGHASRPSLSKTAVHCGLLVLIFLLLGKLAFWVSVQTGTLNAVFYINSISLPD